MKQFYENDETNLKHEQNGTIPVKLNTTYYHLIFYLFIMIKIQNFQINASQHKSEPSKIFKNQNQHTNPQTSSELPIDHNKNPVPISKRTHHILSTDHPEYFMRSLSGTRNFHIWMPKVARSNLKRVCLLITSRPQTTLGDVASSETTYTSEMMNCICVNVEFWSWSLWGCARLRWGNEKVRGTFWLIFADKTSVRALERAGN